MRLYLESMDLEALAELERWGSFAGVSLTRAQLAEAGLAAVDAAALMVRSTRGDVLVPVEGGEADSLEEQVRRVNAADSPRVMLKLGVEPDGLEVMHRLRDERIWTAAAPVSTLGQALLAASSGADLLVFDYRSSSGRAGVVRDILELCRARGGRPRVIVSGIGGLDELQEVIRLAPWGAVVEPSMAWELLDGGSQAAAPAASGERLP